MMLECPECSESFETETSSEEAICPSCGKVVPAADRASAETVETPPGPPARLAETVTGVCDGGRHEAVPASLDCPVCGRETPLGADAAERVECPECGTSFIPDKVIAAARRRRAPETPEGRMLGAYRLGERIGSGGFGIVYKAVHSLLDREAAVKVLSPAIARDPDHRERFLREARLASALDHPGVVKVFEAALEGDILYIAMEYVGGKTLDEMVEEKGERLAPKDAAEMVLGMCSGLQAAHEAGILHRDIKPANVIVSETGEVKLTDFGIARRLNASTILTQPGHFMGTPGYIAPEQFEGEDLDQRADIYSLGAVLYFLLTGEAPYAGEDPMAILFKRRWEQVPPARELVPGVPKALSDIAARMLAKSALQRYPSCDAVARDLTSFLDGEDVKVDVPTGEVPRSELPFGVVALREKLVTEDALLQCIRIQENVRARGAAVPPMGTIMVREGLISAERVPHVLGLQRSTAVRRLLGPDKARVSVSREGKSTVIRVTGACSQDALVADLEPMITGIIKGGAEELVLDTTGFRSVTADVAGAILSWAEAVQKHKRRFKLLCSQKGWNVFAQLGLTEIITVEKVDGRTSGPDGPLYEFERRSRPAPAMRGVGPKLGGPDRLALKPRAAAEVIEPSPGSAVRSEETATPARRGERRAVVPAGRKSSKRPEEPAVARQRPPDGAEGADVRVPATSLLASARTLTKSCRRFLAKVTRWPRHPSESARSWKPFLVSSRLPYALGILAALLLVAMAAYILFL